MTNPRKITSNYSTLKSRFSRRFLGALIRINNSNNSSTISRSAIRKYSSRVKVAAYVSMALAVGTRRAWSRATLRNIRRQKLSSSSFLKRSDGRTSSKHTAVVIPQPPPPLIRKQGIKKKKVKGNIGDEALSTGTQLEMKKLREVVPGGENMETCCLLEETADYIKCLATQVQVMKRIADLCCP